MTQLLSVKAQTGTVCLQKVCASPSKKACFVFVDSKDSPVTEEFVFRPEFVVSEVLTLGDELHLEFPDY